MPSAIQWERLSDIRPSAALRLAFLVVAHLTIYSRHSRRSIPRHAHGSVLVPHILSGFIEIFRFAIQDLWSHPRPNGLDVALCLVQSGTNAVLAWNLKQGIPAYTRPSYLSGAILRPILTISAYHLSSPPLHLCSIYLLDGFIYTRLLIFLLRGALPNFRARYMIAVPAAAVIAAATAGWRCGSQESRLPQAVGVGRWSVAMLAAGTYVLVTVALIGVRNWWQGGRSGIGRPMVVKRGLGHDGGELDPRGESPTIVLTRPR